MSDPLEDTEDEGAGAPVPFEGPLHLQGYLAPCEEKLAGVVRQAVAHPLSVVRKLICPDRPSSYLRYLDEAERTGDPQQKRISSKRRALLKQHMAERISRQSSERLTPLPRKREQLEAEEKAADAGGALFLVETNEEDGVVRAFSRKTGKMILLYDRTLYWGMPRKGEKAPETWPYRSSCGGHTFEVAIAFDYGEDALDENDMHFVTIAVRCVATGEIHVILDEEAF
ncbi:MAG: hypothetical protein M5U26_02935 [Planctomycetota bacterium]|nr:hypothetical protein [Planctomycetota bacterium]